MLLTVRLSAVGIAVVVVRSLFQRIQDYTGTCSLLRCVHTDHDCCTGCCRRVFPLEFKF